MIITEKKDIQEILGSLEGKKTVYLFGCDSCAEQCSTGGKKELEEMARVLEENGIRVLGSSLPEETCYRQLVLKAYRENEALREAEAVLVLACGAGVRTVADAAEESQPVLPALDSTFLATVERVGRFFEGCSLCGECVLAATGGICPHTECPKGLLNGPCGGVADGMCEVNIECECAWVRIYRRLERQGRLDLLRKTAPPKDHSVGIRPRKTLLREPARPAGKKTT
ncbi:MAG: methylenetetrahydrofolate reductase C-terminal domain-containing protein [Deltaproteobacteria bacterium]|nr:methylenetetrahydrofolate reductase C-terminal domain-containing protein [Deltaproteobacteria bacterium]MCL4874122.1 methylenetetrahydrofolate reductase C-terminal domain-containing protein [bacterium]